MFMHGFMVEKSTHKIRLGHRLTPVPVGNRFQYRNEWRATCRCGWRSAWCVGSYGAADAMGRTHIKKETEQ